jgi:cob(I)alamin adenosyltransferase
MKIYTGTGDRGKTSLFSGERVEKSHRRIEAFGDVDELNSWLGVLAAELPPAPADLLGEIRRIQSDLFHVGAWLATVAESAAAAGIDAVTAETVRGLESAIDRMEADLRPLTGFILPGGHRSAALAHVARTVCRRAERRVVRLTAENGPPPDPDAFGVLLCYLNRLSDYLFVLARFCNHLAGTEDIDWNKT